MKHALQSLASLVAVDITKAERAIRRHPLFNEEIRIDEELINLQESLASYRVSQETLDAYPATKRHILREQQQIIQHTLGLIARMIRGERMQHTYTDQDITFAITRATRLLIAEAQRVNKSIDDEVRQALKPYLSIRQRIAMREWSFDIRVQLALLRRRLGSRFALTRSQ